METKDVIKKPQSVATAVNLLWASLAIGVLKTIVIYSKFSAILSPAAFAFENLIGFAFIAFLILKVSAGRNWARIAHLAVFVLLMLHLLFGFSWSVVIALSVAQVGLQAYALFLLFTQPGSIWFSKKAIPA